ncbi:hypothetical protein VI817_008042 [Penicillium citrinum]|nr:hypothetical protein VI817_008042 [Penicillium citrinum]
MSRIESLPDELILQITSFSSESSLAALARTNRHLQQICTPILYRHNVLYNNSSALEWAAHSGRMDTLQKSLFAGAPLPKTKPEANFVKKVRQPSGSVSNVYTYTTTSDHIRSHSQPRRAI